LSYSDNDNALWLKNTATDGIVQILPPAENVYGAVAAISPDNNYIYYYNQPKEAKSEILKMSLFGGTSQQKITGDVWSDAALSPNGQQLAFVRVKSETGEYALVLAHTDGTGERELAINQKATWFGIWNQPTAWSPDGRQIACVGGEYVDGKELWLIRIFEADSGKEVSSIKPDPAWNSIESIAWLPNGDDLLVISGNPSSEEQLYKHTISTGEWRRLTNDLINYHGLSVAADGKTIVTVQYENLGNLWLMPASGDVSRAKQITFGRNLLTDATGVSWTPAGKIVYATNAGGKWGIWMIDPDGTNQKELTQNCAGNDSCSEPVVSPDGRYIVFQARRNGVRNIWRMEADGSNPAQLTDDGGSVPSITNDGRSVVYILPTSPATALWQVPIEGGESKQFSKIPSAASAAFSPDSKRMAFGYYDPKVKNPWQTCIAAIEADTPEKCYGISRSYPRWAADGKAFYYLDHGYAGIWKQPLFGERVLFLEFAGERTNNFAFSPDRKSLVVARSKPTQDIVVITDEN
jgi:Tol biopolymer transport system component